VKFCGDGGEFGESAYVLSKFVRMSPVSMNRFERRPLSAGEAEIEYLDGESGFCVPALSCAAQ